MLRMLCHQQYLDGCSHLLATVNGHTLQLAPMPISAIPLFLLPSGDESEVMMDAHTQAGFIVGVPFAAKVRATYMAARRWCVSWAGTQSPTTHKPPSLPALASHPQISP